MGEQVLHLLAEISLDDAGNVATPVGLTVFLITYTRIMVGVMSERAKVCEVDRARCYDRLDGRDVLIAGLTEEVKAFNADGRRSDEDVRRYLDERFTDIRRALAELRERG